ncbi:MAG: hypothetical protein U0165_08900 [Polyangiaceae bacterium]
MGAPGVSLAVVHALKQDAPSGAALEIPVAVIVPRRGMAIDHCAQPIHQRQARDVAAPRVHPDRAFCTDDGWLPSD